MDDTAKDIVSSDRLHTDHIRGYYYDFIPILVPGNIFLVFVSFGVIIPILALLSDLEAFVPHNIFLAIFDKDVKIDLSTVILLIIPIIGFWLILTYVIGFIFFRQEPRIVDTHSFRFMGKTLGEKGAVRLLPGKETIRTVKIEFPYRDLKLFFSERGLNYLSDHIPWDAKSPDKRTKHFANALKIRIKLDNPDAYHVIAKNEADVRTASSLWFALRLVQWLTLFGLITSISPIIYFYIQLQNASSAFSYALKFVPSFYLIFGQIVIIIGCAAALRAIKATFHYQRQREISFIMETAHWLFLNGRNANMFSGLDSSAQSVSSQPTLSN